MTDELSFFNSFMFKAEDGSWFMMPVCNFFGLDYDNQLERINKDRICQTDTGLFPSMSVFGDNRKRLTLRNRGFTRWVQMTSTSNIRVELREKYEIFQANIFEYLWSGTQARNQQLEDLRNFNINIQKALDLRRLLKAYISEQDTFKKICINNEPSEWNEIRNTLKVQNYFPIAESEKLVIFKQNNQLSIDEINHRKQQINWNLSKSKHMLDYQSRNVQKELNPMPPGVKREKLKLRIKNWEKELLDLEKQQLKLNK